MFSTLTFPPPCGHIHFPHLHENPAVSRSQCAYMKSIWNHIWMSWMRRDSQFKVYKVTIGQTRQMLADSWMGMCTANFAPRLATLLWLWHPRKFPQLPQWLCSCWQWPAGCSRNVWICCCVLHLINFLLWIQIQCYWRLCCTICSAGSSDTYKRCSDSHCKFEDDCFEIFFFIAAFCSKISNCP